MNNNVITVAEQNLEFVSNLAEKWKSRFDNPPHFQFVFTLQDEDLYLNGDVLCPAELVDTNACSIDVESIKIGLVTGDFLMINIIWPADGPITTYIEMFPVNGVPCAE